ncbi:MAG: deoxyribose-phosphate aldolase [Firmicutes bacterium]|nr:deoxyribose-phosphate aldolase [Bacillota bacterium]
MDIAAYIDSTNLRPEASANDIENLCREAVEYHMAAVCVNPCRLVLAKGLLAGSEVKLCTVIGFPLGAEGLASKFGAAAQALENGADEVDMVINIGAVKDEDYDTVIREVEAVLALKKQRKFTLKVIVETALLTGIELAMLTIYLSQTKADYIKTSTGFASRGVSLEDIEIINGHKEEGLKIKASGGIRDLGFALELLRAGVDRLGTSQAVKLIEEYRRRGEL